MKIDHISVSRKGCFEDCQKKYKYRYHLKVIPNGPPPVFFEFGKVVHKIIEEYTLARGQKKVTDLTRDVMSGAIPLEGRTDDEKKDFVPKPIVLPQEYRNKLGRHVQNFMKLSDKIGTDGDVEWPVKIDLDPPHNRCLVGFIDRVIRKGDEFFILDWKTSKVSPWRKDARTITKDLQLQSYCWYICTTFKVPAKNVKAALYYLEDAKLVPAQFSEKTLAEVPGKLLSTYKEIESTNPDKAWGNVGRGCRYCDFRDQCTDYRLTA